MSLISPDLAQNFEGLRQKLAAGNPADVQATNRVEVQVVHDQHSVGTVRGFTVVQDEPTTSWGTGQGPTPTDYFAASIGFCENVIFVRTASMAHLAIDSLATTVTGSWDRRGLFEIDSISPRFTRIAVETRVVTREPPEKVAEVARLTHRRCPIHATLSRATTMVFTLMVNGQPVAL
jgi:uncharacterized OsmC-like protein